MRLCGVLKTWTAQLFGLDPGLLAKHTKKFGSITSGSQMHESDGSCKSEILGHFTYALPKFGLLYTHDGENGK